MESLSVKKILFITLSNIGDVILTIPTIIKLSEIYKNAKFDIVGDKRSEVLFKNCPFKRKFYYKDKSRGISGTLNLIKTLRHNKYDIAVDLRTDGLLYLIKADKKFHKVKNNTIHSIEKHYMSLQLPVKSIPKPKVWITKEEELRAKKLIPLTYKNILTLGIGANSQHKIWPAKFFADLAQKLHQKFDLIVLVGDLKDDRYTPIFQEKFKGNVLNMCGKLDLLTTAAVLKNSELFIGNDSGLGHIASAVKTKTFTIFGPGEPHRYKPWGGKSFYLQDKEKIIQNVDPLIVYKKIVKKFELNIK